MTSVGRIVLHVGAPKTGSTYLQRRLRMDPAGLRAQGIYVPVLPAVAKMAGNAKLLATVLSDAPSLSFRRAFPDIDTSAIDPQRVVDDLLRDWRPEREAVVLSAENFRPGHAAVVARLLPPKVDVGVVLFIRRQDSWIESYHNQMVKTGENHEDLSRFLDVVFDSKSDRLCYPDWSLNREAWREAFGACAIVFYDEAQSDIFGAFFHAASLTLPEGVPDIDRQQVSLDLHQLSYLLALDPTLPFAEFARRRAASAAAAARLGAPRLPTMRPADRERLVSRLAASNKRLLESLGRSADDPALCLTNEPMQRASLEEVRASESYQRHRKLADDIYDRATSDSVQQSTPAS